MQPELPLQFSGRRLQCANCTPCVIGRQLTLASARKKGTDFVVDRPLEVLRSDLARCYLEQPDLWAVRWAEPWMGGYLLRRKRNLKLSEEIKEIAWKAQHRLH